ncbi:hypothetical protein GCM10025867_45820 (plasmid) [Frondihabitans sucicola]|uniref:Uncharacterized protein n=1 Tax=Frondihabitans sucicola TaxID=1268041 RepID=A0ABM8GV49_9MICO|nr:hypothetical protein [Frondihabitans sucicola]BDZ52341.1 hypothetical protein GCM10025867_45820 [Frondihabitans sucicola]
MPLKTITTMKYAPGLARALGEPGHIKHVRVLGRFSSKRAFAEALDAAKLAYSLGVEARDATVSGKEYPDLAAGVLYALRVDAVLDEPRLVSALRGESTPAE